MSATAQAAPYMARHGRPRPQRAHPVKRFSSAMCAVRRHPKFAVAALFVVVAVVFAVRPSVGWEALTAAVAFVFGCGVGGARRQRMAAREVDQ